MPWFQHLCRNVGLAIHNVKHPDKSSAGKQVVSKKIEEKQIDETITLRKTTIEEIEMKTDANHSKAKGSYDTDLNQFKKKYSGK